MRVKIYQIDSERDINKIKLFGYDSLQKFQGSSDVNSSIYDEVFNAEIENSLPEDVFIKFNTEMHPLFRGHSLSVSDVVVTPQGAFFCDNFGFKKIDFDESKTQKPDNLMRVVYVEPNRPAYETEIRTSLEALQKAVGGYIEVVYNDDDTIIICNEEGKLQGLPGNRHLDNGTSIIAGSFFIIGDDGEEFRSLTDEETEKYVNKYSQPEEISDEEVQGDMGCTFITM